MSTLYEIKAEKIEGSKALLEVNAVHPDSLYIPAEASFALMILREASDRSALSKEVAFEDTLDEVWMKKFAKGFVRAVAVTDVKNEGKRGMRARMHVTVSHPAWVSHLKPGATWDSAAFDVVREYDEHEPIAPQTPKTTSVVSLDEHEEMFISVPRECFTFSDFGYELPALLRMPAYAASCYSAGARWKRGDDPATWVGKPVLAGSRAGVVGSIKDDWAMVVEISQGSRGSFGVAPTELARLVPKDGRRGTRLTYAYVLRCAGTTVAGVEKDGDTLDLEVRIPPDGRALPFETETDAFEMLVAPLVPRQGSGEFLPSELTSALVADLAERDMEGSHRLRDVRAELAKKYVRVFTLEQPATTRVPSLDTIPPKAAHAAIAGPWPTAKLRIVVTDPRWIAHLGPSSYASRAIEERPLEPPREPAPKIAPPPIVRPDARVVLWFARDTSDKIWMIERFGTTLKTRFGRRRDKHRTEKNQVLGDEAAAIKAFDKAVASKTREGYAAPFTTEQAVAIVAQRLGVMIDDASGELASGMYTGASIPVGSAG